jgi:hypothetical protein
VSDGLCRDLSLLHVVRRGHDEGERAGGFGEAGGGGSGE